MEKQAIVMAAREALFVQDACNLSDVVHSWSKILSEVLWPLARKLGKGTDWVNSHPINVLFASKVASLTGSEGYMVFSKAYDRCKQLEAIGSLEE